MNVDNVIKEIEGDVAVPGTTISRIVVPVNRLKDFGLRKPKGLKEDVERLNAWRLTVGEADLNGMQDPPPETNVFYGYLLRDVLKKAKAWREEMAGKAK